jgi:PhnB protein
MSGYKAEGFRAVTAYPVVKDAPAFIEFLKEVFGAEEKFRTIGGAGGVHAEVRIGDSMLMLGGGGPGLKWADEARPMPFHISVPDVDTTWKRALAAGATSLSEPADQPWRERTANVKDPFGNFWYIGTHKGETFHFPGLPMLQPYLQPTKPEALIEFIVRAFPARESGRNTAPDGKLHHSMLAFDDAMIEVTEAAGPYQPMPSMFYLYVPDVDAAYRQAMSAGAVSLSEPAMQPYGERVGAVRDPFENSWYLATHIPK